MAKSKPFVIQLEEYAWEYITECLTNTKEVVSGSGKVVKISDRYIPTIDYFLRIWIPLKYNKSDTIKRQTYYRWLKWENTFKQKVIENINENFKSLAGDVVANEGRGIFYAKNKLGWTDKVQNENNNTNIEQPLFGEEL